MKCFEVANKFLDLTYHEIPGDQTHKDQQITSQIMAMSGQYKSLLSNGGPDFSSAVTRFAYVFEYVPAHAHWLFELVQWCKEAQDVLRRDKFRVTCLGGGPGSDLVGLLKYASRNDLEPSVFCEIVDGCISWKSTWADLAWELDLTSVLHTDYVVHDVSQRATWAAPQNFAKADLFTLSFFVSEITPHNPRASQYLAWALQHAKPGAIVLMNDNNDSRFYEWFDQLTETLGFETLLSGSGERKIYDISEQKSALAAYSARFSDRQPKLTGNLSWRALRKPQ